MLILGKCINDTMEIELKTVFQPQDLQKFLQSEFYLKHLLPGTGEKLHLVSTYYDSPSRRLRKEGTVYRVRSTTFADGHQEFESTTKRTVTKTGGMACREEINTPQKDDKPIYPDVEPLFSTKVERQISLLQFEGAVFEMAVDRGCIETVNGKCSPIDEVEFEVKEGNGEDLEKLRQHLYQVAVFQEESQSKFARGLALLGE